MKDFMPRHKQVELIAAGAAGHNKLHDPMRQINGYVVNKEAKINQSQQRRFQLYHADLLSVPKSITQKYDDTLE